MSRVTELRPDRTDGVEDHVERELLVFGERPPVQFGYGTVASLSRKRLAFDETRETTCMEVVFDDGSPFFEVFITLKIRNEREILRRGILPFRP